MAMLGMKTSGPLTRAGRPPRKPAKGRQALGRNPQAGGLDVPAQVLQVRVAGLQAGVQIDAGNAPGGAAPLIPLQGDQDHRPIVPVPPPGRRRRRSRPRASRGGRGPGSGRSSISGCRRTIASMSARIPFSSSCRPAFRVLSVWASSRAVSIRSVVSSSTDRPAWSIRPAAFRRGPSRKATSSASAGRLEIPQASISATRPGRRVAADQLEPGLGQDAVVLEQGDHVRDGAECDQVAERAQVGLGAALPETVVAQMLAQGDGQAEGDADAGQVLEAGWAVAAFGVDDRHRRRKGVLHVVVIGDDHVDPGGARRIHRGVAARSAIHGDHQRGLDAAAATSAMWRGWRP